MSENHEISKYEWMNPPKPILTFQQWTEILDRENKKREQLRREINTLILDIKAQIKERWTEMNEMREEINKIRADMDEMGADIKVMHERLDKIEIKSPQVEQTKKITQLEEEIDQLKEENSTLKTQIQYLWKLFTTFLENKRTALGKNLNTFFGNSKDSSLSSVEEQKNKTPDCNFR